MKPKIRITPLLLIFIMAVELQSQPQTGLQPFGLDGKNIGWLATPSTHVSARHYLYATTAEGIFRRDISNPDSILMNLGLKGKHITAIDIQVRGIGPAIFQTPIVAVSIDYPSPDSIPIYRLADQTWVPADSGIIDAISALASFASSGHEPPGLAFAAGLSSLLFRASTANSVWTEIYNGGIGPGFTVLQAHQTETGKTIWVEDLTATATWRFLVNSMKTGRRCFGVHFHARAWRALVMLSLFILMIHNACMLPSPALYSARKMAG